MPEVPLKVQTAKAAGTAHVNSTDEAVLGSYTIKANTLHAGKGIQVYFCGRVIDNNSTDTLTIRIRIGPTTLTGTAVYTSTAVDSEDGDVFVGWLMLKSRGLGDDQTVVAYGACNDPDATLEAAQHFAALITNLDTNVDNLIEITADWSVAHADNEVQLEDLTVFEI